MTHLDQNETIALSSAKRNEIVLSCLRLLGEGVACQAEGENHRLWSLWDIMNHFKAFDLANLVHTLASLRYTCIGAKDVANVKMPGDSLPVKEVCDALELAEAVCKEAQLAQAAESAGLTLGALKIALQFEGGTDFSTLGSDLQHVLLDVLREMRSKKFLFIAADRVGDLDQDALFGLVVFEAFPSARNDIRDAGNCLAAECPTAAVFHLMRAVEWGLRALCVDLGFRRLRRKNKKTGRVTYARLEYSEWESMLNVLQDRVDARLLKMKRGPDKHALQVFYYPALQDIRGIRDAWRNHTMHTRSEYNRDEAKAILERVRQLMTKLAERVKE